MKPFQSRYNLNVRLIAGVILFVFTTCCLTPLSSAQMALVLPAAGVMVNPSPFFEPAIIKGITIQPDNPLKFDFIIDQGENPPADESARRLEFIKLIKYFLVSLTVPEDELWVNLSPYEKERMIPDGFAKTEMGRDLLAQDYILKQLTASLIYPENDLGKKFWDKIYKEAQAKYGTTDIPVNTFNKVWIVPDEAQIYESGNSAYLLKSHLKVMLEEDYLSLQHNSASEDLGTDTMSREQVRDVSSISSAIVREIVIPAIEKEVNEGENFAQLRQINNSLILAAWFKVALKESLLGKVYADKNKVAGVQQDDVAANQKIYAQYLEAFKKGVYNFIKEDEDPVTHEMIPRKYFSGGYMSEAEKRFRDGDPTGKFRRTKSGADAWTDSAMLRDFERIKDRAVIVDTGFNTAISKSPDAAMLSSDMVGIATRNPEERLKIQKVLTGLEKDLADPSLPELVSTDNGERWYIYSLPSVRERDIDGPLENAFVRAYQSNKQKKDFGLWRNKDFLFSAKSLNPSVFVVGVPYTGSESKGALDIGVKNLRAQIGFDLAQIKKLDSAMLSRPIEILQSNLAPRRDRGAQIEFSYESLPGGERVKKYGALRGYFIDVAGGFVSITLETKEGYQETRVAALKTWATDDKVILDGISAEIRDADGAGIQPSGSLSVYQDFIMGRTDNLGRDLMKVNTPEETRMITAKFSLARGGFSRAIAYFNALVGNATEPGMRERAERMLAKAKAAQKDAAEQKPVDLRLLAVEPTAADILGFAMTENMNFYRVAQLLQDPGFVITEDEFKNLGDFLVEAITLRSKAAEAELTPTLRKMTHNQLIGFFDAVYEREDLSANIREAAVQYKIQTASLISDFQSKMADQSDYGDELLRSTIQGSLEAEDTVTAQANLKKFLVMFDRYKVQLTSEDQFPSMDVVIGFMWDDLIGELNVAKDGSADQLQKEKLKALTFLGFLASAIEPKPLRSGQAGQLADTALFNQLASAIVTYSGLINESAERSLVAVADYASNMLGNQLGDERIARLQQKLSSAVDSAMLTPNKPTRIEVEPQPEDYFITSILGKLQAQYARDTGRNFEEKLVALENKVREMREAESTGDFGLALDLLIYGRKLNSSHRDVNVQIAYDMAPELVAEYEALNSDEQQRLRDLISLKNQAADAFFYPSGQQQTLDSLILNNSNVSIVRTTTGEQYGIKGARVTWVDLSRYLGRGLIRRAIDEVLVSLDWMSWSNPVRKYRNARDGKVLTEEGDMVNLNDLLVGLRTTQQRVVGFIDYVTPNKLAQEAALDARLNDIVGRSPQLGWFVDFFYKEGMQADLLGEQLIPQLLNIVEPIFQNDLNAAQMAKVVEHLRKHYAPDYLSFPDSETGNVAEQMLNRTLTYVESNAGPAYYLNRVFYAVEEYLKTLPDSAMLGGSVGEYIFTKLNNLFASNESSVSVDEFGAVRVATPVMEKIEAVDYRQEIIPILKMINSARLTANDFQKFLRIMENVSAREVVTFSDVLEEFDISVDDVLFPIINRLIFTRENDSGGNLFPQRQLIKEQVYWAKWMLDNLGTTASRKLLSAQESQQDRVKIRVLDALGDEYKLNASTINTMFNSSGRILGAGRFDTLGSEFYTMVGQIPAMTAKEVFILYESLRSIKGDNRYEWRRLERNYFNRGGEPGTKTHKVLVNMNEAFMSGNFDVWQKIYAAGYMFLSARNQIVRDGRIQDWNQFLNTLPPVTALSRLAAFFHVKLSDARWKTALLATIGTLAIDTAQGEDANLSETQDLARTGDRTNAEQIVDLSQKESSVGGIDLNPANINLKIKKDGNGIILPLEEQDFKDFDIPGFEPVIINVTPLNALPFAIGQNSGADATDPVSAT